MAVYFATAGAYVKIGYSADPTARVATITTAGKRPADLPRGSEADLIGWVPGDAYVEMAWHVRFADDRAVGEWFYLDPNAVHALIWDDPRGVDIQRMSALAVFTARARPDLTRSQIADMGVPLEGRPFGPDALGRAS